MSLTITRPMHSGTAGPKHFVRLTNITDETIDIECPDRHLADQLTIALNNFAISFHILTNPKD